jgi:CBS domain-containing protein
MRDANTSSEDTMKRITVKDIMTASPACCTPDTELSEAARLMVEHDCGEIPVVDAKESMKTVGVITDRDITCRAVGAGKNPLTMKVRNCMSTPVVTIDRDATLDGAARSSRAIRCGACR